MAIRQDYVCDSCGYSSMISGKKDALMSGPTTPCTCKKCRNLVDVIDWSGRVPSEPDPSEKSCPHCQQRGGLVLWDTAVKPCPRCPKGKMGPDPGGMVVYAD